MQQELARLVLLCLRKTIPAQFEKRFFFSHFIFNRLCVYNIIIVPQNYQFIRKPSTNGRASEYIFKINCQVAFASDSIYTNNIPYTARVGKYKNEKSITFVIRPLNTKMFVTCGENSEVVKSVQRKTNESTEWRLRYYCRYVF